MSPDGDGPNHIERALEDEIGSLLGLKYPHRIGFWFQTPTRGGGVRKT